MGKFRVGGRVVRYRVRENGASKYLVLNLRKDRILEISIPRKSGLTAKKILEKKRPWIERKYEEVSKRKRMVGRKRVLYRGQEYPLKIVRKGGRKVKLLRNEITVATGKESAKSVLEKWMAGKSKVYSSRRAATFARLLGIDPRYTVEVRDMKSWGRCVDKKHLVFNWRLISLPPRLAEYVVAHELVHLVEGGHAKRFERKLAAICPQYKTSKEELKKYWMG